VFIIPIVALGLLVVYYGKFVTPLAGAVEAAAKHSAVGKIAAAKHSAVAQLKQQDEAHRQRKKMRIHRQQEQAEKAAKKETADKMAKREEALAKREEALATKEASQKQALEGMLLTIEAEKAARFAVEEAGKLEEEAARKQVATARKKQKEEGYTPSAPSVKMQPPKYRYTGVVGVVLNVFNEKAIASAKQFLEALRESEPSVEAVAFLDPTTAASAAAGTLGCKIESYAEVIMPKENLPPKTEQNILAVERIIQSLIRSSFDGLTVQLAFDGEDAWTLTGNGKFGPGSALLNAFNPPTLPGTTHTAGQNTALTAGTVQ
jgi:hypothetical protein